MILSVNNLSFHITFSKNEIERKIPIIFLHGFTGSSKDWEFTKSKIPKNYTPIFIDLLGHGKSSSPEQPEYYTTESQLI